MEVDKHIIRTVLQRLYNEGFRYLVRQPLTRELVAFQCYPKRGWGDRYELVLWKAPHGKGQVKSLGKYEHDIGVIFPVQMREVQPVDIESLLKEGKE